MNDQKRQTLGLPSEKKTQQAESQAPRSAAPDVQVTPTPSILPSEAKPARSIWHPMEEVPKDGRYIFLDGDPNREEWFYYKTRHMNGGHWEPTGWLRARFGTYKPQFDPKGWRGVREEASA
jgi:hypothetical protein